MKRHEVIPLARCIKNDKSRENGVQKVLETSAPLCCGGTEGDQLGASAFRIRLRRALKGVIRCGGMEEGRWKRERASLLAPRARQDHSDSPLSGSELHMAVIFRETVCVHACARPRSRQFGVVTQTATDKVESRTWCR